MINFDFKVSAAHRLECIQINLATKWTNFKGQKLCADKSQTAKDTEEYNKVFITNKQYPLLIGYRSFNKTVHKSFKK